MTLEMSRRSLLLSGAALGVAGALPSWPLRAAESGVSVVLEPRAGIAQFSGPDGPKTAVWGYGGTVPGPEIRVRQGERLTLEVVNRLEQATSLHPHGIRLPNDQDGAPPLTPGSIAPGERHVQSFMVPDAGTYWYHPHLNSAEQLGRGVLGVLVVEEREPPAVDRDLSWLMDDWRLDKDGQIDGQFSHFHDLSHAGRWGNSVTVNGRTDLLHRVKVGERVRLRLVNGANARIFALLVDGAEGWVMAVDGQPLTRPQALSRDEPVLLGPGMRADLFLDVTTMGRIALQDLGRGDKPILMAALEAVGSVSGHAGSGEPAPLPPNPVAMPKAEPDVRHRFVLTGGAMGGMAGAVLDGTYTDMRSLVGHGLFWAINGVVPMTAEHAMTPDPLLSVARGQTVVLELVNDTAWPHPIHLHGHSFVVQSRGGVPLPEPELRDTVLLLRGERVEIAFVADNPGDWMFHCHVLEHQVSGMMGFIRVT